MSIVIMEVSNTVGWLFSVEYNFCEFRVFLVHSRNLSSRILCLVQFDLAVGSVREI